MTRERRSFSLQRVLGKWAGLLAGVLAWFADQQVVAATVYAACPAHSLAFVAGVGAACALLAAAGGAVSSRVRHALPAGEETSATARTDRFIATMSVLVAALSFLAIVFATPAALFLRCERF
jgi:NADH:ubiquinone oxidoreductase subunit 5 (subunit L)/multisubunit Na+/H+ antiporter MnhA subunit